MTWIDQMRARIARNVARLPGLTSEQKNALIEAEVSKAVSDTEAGRPFNAPDSVPGPDGYSIEEQDDEEDL